MKPNIWHKRILAALVVLIPISIFAQSPISLSNSNETALKAGVYHGRVVNTATLTPPAVGANKTWDYTGLQGGSIYTNSLIGASAFSSTAVADTNATETIGGSFNIPATTIYDMDATGFFGAGETIAKQDYTLGDITTNYKDSLIFPAQVCKYRQHLLAFPATYNSVWKSNATKTVTVIIKAPSYFLPNDSANKISHITVTDSVVGWGNLTIPSANKSSIPYPVLLVKERTKTIDSFFLMGSPAPSILLQDFGVMQGGVSSNYSEYFYRAGTLEPLLTIGYDTDYTYANPSTAEFTADNVQSGIENQSPVLQNVSLYPNPATSGTVQCDFNKLTSEDWQLNVINSLGQVVDSKIVSGTGNLREQIDLSSITSGGLYIVEVINENGAIAASGKLNLVR